MLNSFLLRCTLFGARLIYYLLPFLRFIVKILFWGLILFVIILLLFIIF